MEHLPTVSNNTFLFISTSTVGRGTAGPPSSAHRQILLPASPSPSDPSGTVRGWAERLLRGSTDDRALPTRLAYASVRKPVPPSGAPHGATHRGSASPRVPSSPAGRLPESQAPCTNTGCVLCVRPHSFVHSALSSCSSFFIFVRAHINAFDDDDRGEINVLYNVRKK